MFEKASRLRLRWNHSKGLVSSEDLWILPLEELNTMYKKLRSEQKTQDEDSLLETTPKKSDSLDLKISILKRVVEIRLAEMKAIEQTAHRKSQKDKLLGILAEKEDAELRGKSSDDLRKLINELD